MVEPTAIDKRTMFARLPPLWPDATLRDKIRRGIAKDGRCVVALDDDPTGSQTVHDVWVLTRWALQDLETALRREEPALYILTNSRSLPLERARAIQREIAGNLAAASRAVGRPLLVVSRSDSTLRGHFPGEVMALAEVLNARSSKPYDGLCLVPFLAEGGRFTIDDVQWVHEGDRLIPAAQTTYAADPVFGYRHSRLPEWVEEKTNGEIPASNVTCVSLDKIRLGGPEEVANQLRSVQGGRVVVVNAAHERDVEVVVLGLLILEDEGRHFLFRTAASFVKIASGMEDRPMLKPEEMLTGRKAGGGMIIFGSYVPRSSAQLVGVQALDMVASIELPVLRVLGQSDRDRTIADTTAAVDQALVRRHDVLLYTSRHLITGRDHVENLAIGKSVSAALADVVSRVNHEPRYLIAKGGITASDVATEGLGVRAARVLGQVLPGVPVWTLGAESRWPGLPYVVFPGNVGEDHAVADIVRMMR